MISKIKSFKQIQVLSQKIRKQKKKIVFTNGCFDLIHVGHIFYLRKAKALGNVLIVGLNNDRSIRKIKGPNRPIHPERARATVLSALEMIDYIVLFGEETPIRLIKAIQPHVLVKGGDWKIAQMVGAPEVKSWGGQVKQIPLVKGYSTTCALQKLKLE